MLSYLCAKQQSGGMGTFQASFKRLTLPLYHGPHERANILRLCVHLQQFRTLHVGLNQIRAVFGSLEELEDVGLENVYGVAPTSHQ